MVTRNEWCDRLQGAVSDGRFLEDPALWQPHVAACSQCRALVEGLFVLRGLIQRARDEAPVIEPLADRGRGVLHAAFSRYRRHRRRTRWMQTGTALVVLGALGVGWWGAAPPRPAPDPIAYAQALAQRVFNPGGTPDYELLRRDSTLQSEYRAALDHPSSLVRRTALSALLQSGVVLDSLVLERALRGWGETLERPVELAGGSAAAQLAQALDARRSATLVAALRGLATVASRGERLPGAALLTPFLRDPDAHVRRSALWALSFDPTHGAGEELARIFREDASSDVRVEAAAALLKTEGEQGARTVVRGLLERQDWEVERRLIPSLGGFEAGRKLARDRVAATATPLPLALAHALTLVRAGTSADVPALVDRALADPAGEAILPAAVLSAEARWDQYRSALQLAWRRLGEPSNRVMVGLTLVAWDLRVGGADRLVLALEICEHDLAPPHERHLLRLAERAQADVRDRAQAALARLKARSEGGQAR